MNNVPGPTADQEPAGRLTARFAELLGEQPDLGADLLRRYAEPHRHYHNQQHLAQVLDRIDEFATAAHDLFLVRMAAWYHDAVYAIPAGQVTNEEASARLAIRTLVRSGFEQEEIGEIARLVRLTASHRPTGSDPNGELLCDADLAILAAEPNDYRRYVAEVRAEYAALDQRQFDAGRLEILRQFGGQPIFRTTGGRRLEAAAQANLTAEALDLIDRLGVAAEFEGEWPVD